MGFPAVSTNEIYGDCSNVNFSSRSYSFILGSSENMVSSNSSSNILESKTFGLSVLNVLANYLRENSDVNYSSASVNAIGLIANVVM